jgi:hypothetical protein
MLGSSQAYTKEGMEDQVTDAHIHTDVFCTPYQDNLLPHTHTMHAIHVHNSHTCTLHTPCRFTQNYTVTRIPTFVIVLLLLVISMREENGR